MKNILVLLSGSGVYDGSEIHESVLTLLAIDRSGNQYQCAAPNVEQHHVINHSSGEEMDETRNVLVESARIARGNILALEEVNHENYDALVMPGGFGAAKNWSKWAFSGPEGEINPDVKRIVNEFVSVGKPVAGLCMSPTTIAKALEGTAVHASLTVGTTEEASPYDIAAISGGMESIGSTAEMKSVREITVDAKNKIVTTPCYMMEASVAEINEGITQAIDKLLELAD
jgi:enhancing lycopene biosynthesis protein 2